MPELFDNNSIEQWTTEGAIEVNERALTYTRNLLNTYEEPKNHRVTEVETDTGEVLLQLSFAKVRTLKGLEDDAMVRSQER